MFRRRYFVLSVIVLMSAGAIAGQSGEKKSAGAQKSDGGAPQFSAAVATQVLDQLRQGLEGYNRRLLLQCFDARQSTYPELRDQVEELFQKYDSFRVRHRLLEAATQEDAGIVLAEFEIEASPRAGDRSSVRRRDQVRLILRSNGKNWQITEFSPHELFSF
jgi:hypothetical protein